MTVLTAKPLTVFANAASDVGQVGSAYANALANPTSTTINGNLSTDVSTIQNLSAWTAGLSSILLSSNLAPTKEELNGIFKVLSYQLVYLLQEGIPEYNSSRDYNAGSIVKAGSGSTVIWKSLVSENIGNALTEGANWTQIGDLTLLKNLASGTNLAGIAGLTSAANTIPYFTGTGGASALKTIGTATGNIPLIGTQSATTALAGLAPLATTAMVQAGTDANAAITSAALAGAFASSKAANGYIYHPNGLIFQWGQANSVPTNGQLTVTLPITFPTAGLCVTMSWNSFNLTSLDGNAGGVAFVSTSQIIVSNADTTASAYWFAIGY